MAHHFKFEVEVTVTRTQGKFATRDEMAEAIVSILESAEEGLYGIGPDGDSDYEIESWTAQES